MARIVRRLRRRFSRVEGRRPSAVSEAGRALGRTIAYSAMPRPLATAMRVASIFSGLRPVKPRVFLGRRSESLTRYERALKARLIRARGAVERRALIRGEIDRRTRYCRRRAVRRGVVFAAGVAGVRGGRWARMMRDAVHTPSSNFTCR